jgi:hypothetical protein
MKDFIKKNDFVISTILIVLFSIFIFLPFFIYTPLIQLSMDTFDYSYLAKLIFDGNLPVKDLKIDLPIGYPIIIYIVKAAGLNFNNLVFFQLIFYVLSFIFLCFQLSKFTKFGGLITGITFIFFSFNSHTIRHVFRISPDSFYSSFIVLLVAGLFFYFRTKNRLSLIVILFSISGAVLLRSNGIYLLFIIGVLFYEKFRKKDSLKFFFISTLSSLLMLSSFNFKIKDEFAPWDNKRIEKVFRRVCFSGNSSFKKNDEEGVGIKKANDFKFNSFIMFFKSFIQKHPSYYYSLQKSNFENIKNNKTFSNLNQKFFNGKVSILEADKKLLKFMFNDFQMINFRKVADEIQFENHTNNFWIYSVYVVQELLYLSKIYFLIYCLFFACLIHSVYKKNYFLLSIISIHLLSLVLLSVSVGYRVRYISVSEFIIFIVSILYFVDLLYIPKKINTVD